tara:strand:+ start:2001 stop:2807 length:807 start_codon:yes stop_codon:yes gene_type:complete
VREYLNNYGNKIRKLDTIYIGYDFREHKAVSALIESINKNSSEPINIVTLNKNALNRSGLYRRQPDLSSTVWGDEKSGCMIDQIDKRPFSTEFSFSRFLTPFLNQNEGLALYMDCDMYFRSDPIELFDLCYKDMSKAIWCVKHEYDGGGRELKMYGCPQTTYSRKNWSSFVMWNCSHIAHENLTVDDVNTKPGRWLHNFLWINDEDIGSISEEWNWLDGHSSEDIEPKNVHFTTGGPWFEGWKPKRLVDKKYAEDWKVFVEHNGKKDD